MNNPPHPPSDRFTTCPWHVPQVFLAKWRETTVAVGQNSPLLAALPLCRRQRRVPGWPRGCTMALAARRGTTHPPAPSLRCRSRCWAPAAPPTPPRGWTTSSRRQRAPPRGRTPSTTACRQAHARSACTRRPLPVCGLRLPASGTGPACAGPAAASTAPTPEPCAGPRPAAPQKEAAMMASLRHPSIVMYLGVCLDPPAVVTEYCARGGWVGDGRVARRHAASRWARHARVA